MKDTRYHLGDVVEMMDEVDNVGGEEPASPYGVVTDIEDPQSTSPTYIIETVHHNGRIIESDFKAESLRKVEEWNLETEILLENRMEVRVSEGSYDFYEQWGATFYQADGTGVNGESEWIVFRDRQQAKRAAEEKVKQDLRENPGMFNDTFMRKFTYISETDKRMIAQDEASYRTEDRSTQELKDMADRYGVDYTEHRHWDDFDDSLEDEQLKRRALKEMIEPEIAEEIERKLENPFKYYVDERGIYTQEELGQQSFTRMDVEEAADAAVTQDGEGHFLDVYDGKSVELENGAVAYATN